MCLRLSPNLGFQFPDGTNVFFLIFLQGMLQRKVRKRILNTLFKRLLVGKVESNHLCCLSACQISIACIRLSSSKGYQPRSHQYQGST